MVRTPPEYYVNHSRRNQSMECVKLLASIFVVFNHIPLPGSIGSALYCLSDFAVPMFFMICGYFNYQADTRAITRRMLHILKLLLIATMLHLLWGCIATELDGGSTIAYLRAWIPDPDEVVKFFVLHMHPYAGHLWYLIASAATYLVFLLYTRFFEEKPVNYQPFYTLALCLFTVCFASEFFCPILGTQSPFECRNGWFLGIPMFAAGLFIREYQARIFRCFSLTTGKLLLLIVGGMAFSLLQWRSFSNGLLSLGTFVMVVALMLFLVSHPEVPVRSRAAKACISSFGTISTWVYLLHLLVILIYDDLLSNTFSETFGELAAWFGPLFVLLVSLLAAVFCHLFLLMWKKRK